LSDPSEGIVIIGAGPAGLTAAYELSKLGRTALILEQDDIVGGISHTRQHNGYRFDIGGHRFFTKVDYVTQIWHEILGDELITRPRLSRIYYRGRFFDYPLKPVNALMGLGPIEAVRIGFSYLRAQIAPASREVSFEDWVVNRFGRRLFEIFFKTYTEKVWGMPCSEISADWAAQRIKQLDLLVALKNALLGTVATRSGDVVTTLIEEFEYPRLGPGQMWERCTELLAERGSKTLMKTRVVGVNHAGGQVRSVTVEEPGRPVQEIPAEHVLCSMPIRTLLRQLDPAPPEAVRAAAEKLRYRDFLTVALMIDAPELFEDNWIYIHSGDVQVGRVQNFKNWSPDMVPDPSKTALGLEYFVNEGDELWSMADADLIELARKESELLGLIPAGSVIDGAVVRMPKAYPVYDGDYQESLRVIREYLSGIENLQLIGRNGQHRYNNQDHSMVTGVFAARNIVGEPAGGHYDIWDVNVEEEYHEEQRTSVSGPGGDRLVPQAVTAPPLEQRIREVFARIDEVALGVAIGTVAGLAVFTATAVLLLRGDGTMAPNLSLLGSYFLGYQMSWPGALIGLIEGCLGGFGFGWLTARTTNVILRSEEIRTFDSLGAAHAMNLFEGDDR
jgi:protoporphyrinogen oxidase